MKKTFALSSLSVMDAIMVVVREVIDSGIDHEIIIQPIKKGRKKRTISQNKALHLYFTMLAEDLDSAGFDQKAIIDKFKSGFSLPVTDVFIKQIFRECGVVMFKKKSTADLTTVEMQKVWQAVDRSIAEKTGVSVEFPSFDPPIEQEESNGM